MIAAVSAAAGLAAALVVDVETPIVGSVTVGVLFATFAGAALAETFGPPREGGGGDAWRRVVASALALARVLGGTVVGALLAPAVIRAADRFIDGDHDHVVWALLVGLLGVTLLRKLFHASSSAADEWLDALRARIKRAIDGGQGGGGPKP